MTPTCPLAFLGLALLVPASSLAPAQALQAQEIPADLAADVKRSETIGRELHLSDRAAARATDCLLAKLGDLDDKGLGGYLAVRERGADGKPADSWLVSFTSQDEVPRVIQRVRVPLEDRKPEYVETPKPLDLPEALRPLWSARQMAIEAGGPYEQPINPVVLTGGDIGTDDIHVYLLAGSDDPNVVVLGRHVRVRVTKDGAKVTEVAPLTKGIVELARKLPDGKEPVALVVSQVLTDYPTEAHVFASLLYRKKLVVATKRGGWEVESGKVRYTGEIPAPKPQPKAVRGASDQNL